MGLLDFKTALQACLLNRTQERVQMVESAISDNDLMLLGLPFFDMDLLYGKPLLLESKASAPRRRAEI